VVVRAVNGAERDHDQRSLDRVGPSRVIGSTYKTATLEFCANLGLLAFSGST